MTDADGRRIRGNLTDISTSVLALDVSGTRRLFSDSEMVTIEKRVPDSLKNGALIGLSIGAGLFGPAIGASTGDWKYAATDTPVAVKIAPVAIGTGRGVLVTFNIRR